MSVGCRIRRDFPRPDRALVEAFRGLPVANLDDCMGRIAAVDAGLKNVNKTPLLGVAFTVRCPAGDNLMFHKALDLAQPGDILVIASGGSLSRSLCGEIMSTYARSRGIAGFVVDGCIRDYDELSALTDFPVYAQGVTPNGPYKNGPGEINSPVTVDGLLVIKPENAAALAEQGWAVHKKEEGQIRDILAGKGFPRPFVDATLEQLGVEYVD